MARRLAQSIFYMIRIHNNTKDQGLQEPTGNAHMIIDPKIEWFVPLSVCKSPA